MTTTLDPEIQRLRLAYEGAKEENRRLRIALDEIAWMQEPTYTLDDASKRARKELY